MTITIRPGHADDGLATFRVHHDAIADLAQRMGLQRDEEPPTEEDLLKEWDSIRSLYEYLAGCAEQFWVAEREGKIVGYARACRHDGVCALTEFFVHPSAQSQGVGKQLLARAFPPTSARDTATLRFIIATPETAAQSLYMRSGVYARGLIYRFTRAPQASAPNSALKESDLEIVAAPHTPSTLAHIAAIDSVILGFQRDDDHQWIQTDRQAWLYRRNGQVVGYGYVGEQNGPFALLDATDYPAVIAHAESQAAAADRKEFAIWVHSSNRHAIDYLLAEHYKAGRFVTTFLSSAPFGQLDHYINTDPPFLL